MAINVAKFLKSLTRWLFGPSSLVGKLFGSKKPAPVPVPPPTPVPPPAPVPPPTPPLPPTVGANQYRVGALPTPPNRDQMCRVKAAFNGDVSVTTKQLGTVPSWGPEVGMLTDYADRQTTYQAHKVWGATHIVVDLAGSYVENGVSYPNNTAEKNDFTNDMPGLCAWMNEIILNGLIPVLMLDGDDGYQVIFDNLPKIVAAFTAYSYGSLMLQVVFCSGFDSIDSIGLQQYTDNGATETKMLVFIRQTIGPNAVHAKEMWAFSPPVWNFPPNAAWDGIDTFLIEFAGLMLGNNTAPKIIAGTYDAEHGDYAPTYNMPAGQEQPWTIPWQVMKRMLQGYTPPKDQPFNQMVPCTGSAANAAWTGIASVSSDSQGGGGQYTGAGCPRGKQYVVAFEFGTYPATHNPVGSQVAAIQVTRAYLQSMSGFDAVC